MIRIVGSSLALGLCVLAFVVYSTFPALRTTVSGHVPPDPADLSLAVLANTPTPTTQAEMTEPSATKPVATAVLDNASLVALLPTPTVSSLPAMAPEVKPVLLPTVTPTLQPVTIPEQTLALATDQGQPAPVAALSNVSGPCWVESPPPSLGLDPFYAKYCSALGIPIVASGDVPDGALLRAWEIVTQMVNGMVQAEDIRTSIIARSTRIGVIGAMQVTTDMPEHRSLYALFPAVDWNTRARGVGATPDIPLLSIGEENLLCYPGDRWVGQNVLVHEFAHTIKNMGLDFVNPGFHAELQRAYARALEAGLWPDTYVSSNADEYWAEGVRLYFQIETAGVPSGQSYPANSRAELQGYDPELYRLVASVFGAHGGISPCPTP